MTEAVLVVRDALRPPHVIEPLGDGSWYCSTCNQVFFLYYTDERRQGCRNELLWKVPWPR